MFNITSHQGIANQNHNETPLHIYQDDYSKKPDNNKCWGGYEELEPSYIAGKNVRWCSLFGKQE